MRHQLRATALSSFAILSLSLATAACGNASGGGGGSGGSGSTGSTTATTSTTGDTTSSTGTGMAGCMTTSMTQLPGVHIEIDNSQCTFSFADPMDKIAINYQVVVDADVSGVHPRPQDAGHCDPPGPSGLITFEKVDGNQQQYCLCDVGPCPGPGTDPVTIKKGSYPGTFTWDRHNWFGPSDTLNPEGPLFPVGDYTLTVSAIGTVDQGGSQAGFVINATMPIHLIQ